MKLSGYITIILMIGLCFAIFASMINDFGTEYPDIDVNTSWGSEYEYSSEINDSVDDLKDKFDVITSEEGWFGIKIYTGAQIILGAVMFVPKTIMSTVVYAMTILTGVGAEIGIPAFVIVFATVGFFVTIIFKLVSYWHSKTQI